MNNKIAKYILSGIVGISLLLFMACNELDLEPTNKFTDPTYWTSTETSSATLSMAYSQLLVAGRFFSDEKLTDNLYVGRGNPDEKIITSGQADAALGLFAERWKKAFEGIKTCHVFLENVDRVSGMDEALKARMKAEIRFIRAFIFFTLTNHYGDVPLFDRDITVQEANNIERSSRATVLDFVRTELNAIVSDLPTKQQYAEKDNGRITKGAAMVLLARTYLYENDYQNVASITEKIINGDYGTYSLFPSYEGLFLPENEYNSEVILDLGYTLTLRTWGDYYDAIPISAGARINAFAPTQELVDDYVMMNGKTIRETGSGYNEENPYVNRDPRFAKTIVHHGYQWKKGNGSVSTIYIKPGTGTTDEEKLDVYAGQGQNASSTGYYLRKYFDPTAPEGSIAAGLNIILMRYADVLLMYAEAKNELGQMNEEVWNKTIRPIRERAGFTDVSALNYPAGGNLKEIIRRERRCELAIEGLRLFDIRRWKTAETVLNGRPHGAKFEANNTSYILLEERKFNPERDYLFAVPQSQRDINRNLTQNPNY